MEIRVILIRRRSSPAHMYLRADVVQQCRARRCRHVPHDSKCRTYCAHSSNYACIKTQTNSMDRLMQALRVIVNCIAQKTRGVAVNHGQRRNRHKRKDARCAHTRCFGHLAHMATDGGHDECCWVMREGGAADGPALQKEPNCRDTSSTVETHPSRRGQERGKENHVHFCNSAVLHFCAAVSAAGRWELRAPLAASRLGTYVPEDLDFASRCMGAPAPSQPGQGALY